MKKNNARKLEMLKVSDLVPYKRNARIHSDRQIEKICHSITEFGFINPIIVDENNMIVAGHGRIMASQKLGLEKVPCLRVSDLSEEQIRAYILADNKISEDSGWNKDLLNIELQELKDLDFDVSFAGFEIDNIQIDEEIDIEDNSEGYYGDERERTNKSYNLNIGQNIKYTSDFWQMPIIKNDNFIPEDLIGFNYALTNKEKNCGIHCYVDDYQFERLWNNPDKYIDALKEYQCFLSPDFSLYIDMKMSTKIWNTYRSRFIGAYYQSKGLKVIPTISWAEEETFAFCFKGIPKGSIVSISTIGVKDDKKSLETWKSGMDEMIKQIKPSTILVYGGKIDFDYGIIETIYFDNHVTENWKKRNDN